ncbi:hypothetical protein H4217_006900 [Coemansia sp. RSA 1939]|nr:hypothetical protein H4217_006900 [Coemansia sp. RSA 1939]
MVDLEKKNHPDNHVYEQVRKITQKTKKDIAATLKALEDAPIYSPKDTTKRWE